MICNIKGYNWTKEIEITDADMYKTLEQVFTEAATRLMEDMSNFKPTDEISLFLECCQKGELDLDKHIFIKTATVLRNCSNYHAAEIFEPSSLTRFE